MDQPVATVPTTTPTTPDKSPALTEAIRQELLEELEKAEYVDLTCLGKIVEISHHGRRLVAVRNPMVRFDARSIGVSGQPSAGGYGTDYDCEVGTPYPPMNGWSTGPMQRHVNEQFKATLSQMVKESPLAKALRTELIALMHVDNFGPSHLLEVEQLATEGISVLEARCGMSNGKPPRFRGGVTPFAPASSDETFGAAALRALGARGEETEDDDDEEEETNMVETVRAIAVAREAGLDDVAEKLVSTLTPSEDK